MQTDATLWDQFRNGDHQAYEAMYQQEIGFLIQYGLSIKRDEQTVQDAIHDLFVSIWQRRENLSANDNIRRYLLVALRRILIKGTVYTSEISENTFGVADENKQSELIKQEQEKRTNLSIQQGIEQLTKKQKEIINLKFYQGLDYEAIASIMGITYQSCRNLSTSAIKSLQENTSIKNIFE